MTWGWGLPGTEPPLGDRACLAATLLLYGAWRGALGWTEEGDLLSSAGSCRVLEWVSEASGWSLSTALQLGTCLDQAHAYTDGEWEAEDHECGTGV